MLNLEINLTLKRWRLQNITLHYLLISMSPSAIEEANQNPNSVQPIRKPKFPHIFERICGEFLSTVKKVIPLPRCRLQLIIGISATV